MYITGGTSLGEHFQQPHHLPNTGAVSENCAQVTWLQLCIQLLRLTGDAKYADTIERIAYNHLLASQKPSGEALCYFTPLAGKKPYDTGMNCCTSSGPRGIALLTTIAYTTGPRSVQVNFFEPSTLETTIGGVKVKIRQETNYPLDGTVALDHRAREACRVRSACSASRAGAGNGSLRGISVTPSACPWTGAFCGFQVPGRNGTPWWSSSRCAAQRVCGTESNDRLVAVQRGPLVLAIDARMNRGLSLARVTPATEEDGTVNLAAPFISTRRVDEQVFLGEGLDAPAGDRLDELKKVRLVWISFAEAGEDGSNFAVWLPSPERLKKMADAPFLSAKESWSRKGNVEGSIADGDTSTWRVTFDGKRHTEDWFAVEREPARPDQPRGLRPRSRAITTAAGSTPPRGSRGSRSRRPRTDRGRTWQPSRSTLPPPQPTQRGLPTGRSSPSASRPRRPRPSA